MSAEANKAVACRLFERVWNGARPLLLLAFALAWTGCVSSRPQEISVAEPPSSSVYERGQPVATPGGLGTVVRPSADSSSLLVALDSQPHPSTRYPIDSVEALSPELRRLNERVRRKTATLVLTPGDVLRARRLQVRPDSAFWLDPETQQPQRIATAQVQEIRARSHREGLRAGIGVGAVVAVGLGVLIGVGGRNDCGVGEGLSCGLGYLAIGTLGAGLLTVPIGGLLGAATGRSATYRLTGRPPDPNETDGLP